MDHNKLWKTLRDGSTRPPDTQILRPPDTQVVSWETCMPVKMQRLELYMEQWTDSKLGKEYINAVYCHPAYLTSMQNTSWEIPDWMSHKLESRLPGEYQQPQICRWYLSSGRKWKGTKDLLDEGERREWKAGLKFNIWQAKIMASSSITSW